ncbi:MAG: 1-deoxy-D-xylulose-5-phosphate synthase [Rikenellaceae bacterium]|nr:1-deoxy-D-xylulose-5-phosphate synthase [Rikenellaceae bacterium]
MYKFLNRINSPADLKQLSVDELPELCDEIRHYIIHSLSSGTGHIGSSLGSVELAVAIHYVFDTPDDRLIWDVGHQAYAHKIITGRRDEFAHIRQKGGIGGFPRRSESEYDAFVGGHASVSISAALGMASAAQIEGRESKTIAVIGDGAMTGGLAFEGLNNAGTVGADLLVILNDNRMAIDHNRSALRDYLLGISTSKRYNRLKTRVWNMFPAGSRLHNAFKRIHNAFKQGLLRHSNLFESFKFRYFGPVDGHDVKSLVAVLRDLREIKGPKLLHALTTKGKGYKPAEENQVVWHAPGKYNPETGEIIKGSQNGADKFQTVFGQTLVDLADRDGRIVGITPAMPTGCSMDLLAKAHPDRYFDVGIAEGHAVTFSAGLACENLVPFCNIYSTFMQRAFDNIIHDVALQNLGVVMCLDRGGLVGEDGATHHGAYDLSYLCCIPNMTVAAPYNEAELRNMMYTASLANRPIAIRYPRGGGDGSEWRGKEFEELTIGKGRCLREGEGTAVLSIGAIGIEVTKAVNKAVSEGKNPAHYDMRWAKPLDCEILQHVAHTFAHVVTVEDGSLQGGVGSTIENVLRDMGFNGTITRLGIPDQFIEHGTVAELRQMCGIDAESIAAAIK